MYIYLQMIYFCNFKYSNQSDSKLNIFRSLSQKDTENAMSENAKALLKENV